MSDPKLTGQIISVVFFSFIAYFTIGIPLAVLPPYVQSLGFGPLVAGLTISIQYLATFMGRTPAGRMSDSKGPKQTLILGLVACGVSGLFLVLTAYFAKTPLVSLAFLFIGRLFLGFGESFVAMAAILWGIGRVGSRHTAQVISWNGVATYAALAIGAPLGIALNNTFGLSALGWGIFLLGWLSIPIALYKKPTIPIPGKPIPIHQVFGRVLPYGAGLALASIGFGSIATFITLYYASHHWHDAAYALTAFGTVFIGVRLIFAKMIDRLGGYRVAIISLTIECLGLAILWLAPTIGVAFLGAIITGIGFSLVFPALGVESMMRVTPDNRGAALGMYSVFVDVALGITGPVGGWIATRHGFSAIFLFAATASFTALLLISSLFVLKGQLHTAQLT
jgi:MFS family permease